MQVYLAAKETAGLPAAGDASWSNATAGYNPGTGAFKGAYTVGQAGATRYYYAKVVDAAGNAGIYDLGSYATAAAASSFVDDVWTFVTREKADGVGGGNNLPGLISIAELQWSGGTISASDITFLRAVQGVTGDLVDGVPGESGGTVSIANASYDTGNSLFQVKTPKTSAATTWTINYHRPIYRPGLVILKNGAIVYTDASSVATDAIDPSPYSVSYAAPLPVDYGSSAVVPDYIESGAADSAAYAAAQWKQTYVYGANSVVPTFSGDSGTGATVVSFSTFFSIRSVAAVRLGGSATVSMYYKIAGTGSANNKRDFFGLRFNTGDEVVFYLDYQTGGINTYATWPGGSTTFGAPSFASTMRKYTLSVQMITATTATVTATIDNGAGGAYLSYTSGAATMTSAPTSFFALVGFQEDVAPASPSQRMIRDVSLSTTGAATPVYYNPADYTSANATAGTSAKVAGMGSGTQPALSSAVAKDDSDIYVVSHQNNVSSGTCTGPAFLLKYDHAARSFSSLGQHSRTTSQQSVLNYRDLAISMGNGGVPFFAQKFYDSSAARYCFYVAKYSGGAFSQVGTDYGYNAWTAGEIDVASGPASYNVRIACQMSASRVYVGYRASNAHNSGSSAIKIFFAAESATSSTAWTNLALSPSISCTDFSFAFTPAGTMYILANTSSSQFKVYKVAVSGSAGTVTELYTSPATINGGATSTYPVSASIVAFSDTLLGFKFGISAVAATGYISNDAVVLPSAPPGATSGAAMGTNSIDFDAFGNMYYYMSDDSKIYRLPKLGTAWALQQTPTGAILASQGLNRGQVVVSRKNADLVAFVDNYYQVFRPNSTLSM